MTSRDDTAAALQRLGAALAAHGRVLDVVATPATTAARVREELGLPKEFTDAYAAAGPADFGGDAFDEAGLRPEFTERVTAALTVVLDAEEAAAFVQTLA